MSEHTEIISYAAREKAVKEAVAEFPTEFGLRAFPNARFRASLSASYWSDLNHAPLVYTQRRSEATLRDGEWIDFAKGTVTELRREVVLLPGFPWPLL